MCFTDHTEVGMCTITQEQSLVESLFEQYRPEVRPVCNATKPVYVSLELGITKIDQLVGTAMFSSSNREYFTPQNRNMNNQFPSDADLPLVTWRPLGNHIVAS